MSRRVLPSRSRVGAPGPCSRRPVHPTYRRLGPLSLCLLVVSLVLGCEVIEPPPPSPPGPRLYPVSGKVTIDGKPLAKAFVVFLPEFGGGGTHSVGETKEDGTYELSHMDRPGAGRGGYRVTISYIVGPDGKVADLESRSQIDRPLPPELNHGKELLPPRYSDFSKTELGATVTPGGPFIFDFNLKGPLLELPAGGSPRRTGAREGHPVAPGRDPAISARE